MRRRHALAVITLWVSAGVVGGCAGATSGLSITTTTPNGSSEQIPATLSKPDGPGPFPAVVIMHDCSGLGPRSSGAPDRWAKELLARRYVVVLPDSFTTRGHPDGVCTDASPSRNDVSPVRRVRDAYAALSYLRTLPYVDGSHVGLMGGSHGGSTTLATMIAPASDRDPLARDKRAGFAAAVALYPGCVTRPGRVDLSGVYEPLAPLLILIGDKDDWTPAEPCRKLTEAAQQAGYPVTIKVYPGAYHSFDSYNPVRYVATRVNANSPSGRGATTGGDPAAWADSIREVGAFFDRYLK
ncbi:MAG: dienelactone hydrolase family protein [Candidatus Rokuibacteriota bacterium]|nr:MAG: dienelactone hydrolase family protein [Candidatus Rokubacteria bacterium]